MLLLLGYSQEPRRGKGLDSAINYQRSHGATYSLQIFKTWECVGMGDEDKGRRRWEESIQECRNMQQVICSSQPRQMDKWKRLKLICSSQSRQMTNGKGWTSVVIPDKDEKREIQGWPKLHLLGEACGRWGEEEKQRKWKGENREQWIIQTRAELP